MSVLERGTKMTDFYTQMMTYASEMSIFAEAFTSQGERRWKYFDQDGYRKLSSILPYDKYSTYTDIYMFAYYITAIIPTDDEEDEICHIDLEDIAEYIQDYIRNHDLNDINWENVFNYIDEHKDGDNYDREEVEELEQCLAPLKEELLQTDTFCLY